MGVTSSKFTDSFLQSNVSLFNCNKVLLIFLLTFHNFNFTISQIFKRQNSIYHIFQITIDNAEVEVNVME